MAGKLTSTPPSSLSTVYFALDNHVNQISQPCSCHSLTDRIIDSIYRPHSLHNKKCSKLESAQYCSAKMEGEERHIYEPIRQDTIHKDNVYELQHIYVNEDRRVKQPRGKVKRSNNKKQSSSWSPPFIVLTVLLCLILILLVAILCLIVVNMTGRDTATCTSSITAGSTTGSISSLNFTEWADTIASKVNTSVTQSLPNFNEWANGVIHNINTNVTRSFPIWTEDVVHKVTTNVTQSIPKFTAVDSQILQSTSTSAQRLSNIINTLSNLQGTSSSTAGEVDNTLSATKELLSLIRNAPFVLPTSCNQIKNQRPSAGSGNYVLARTHGSENYTTYCNMNNLCGSGGGWTRLAYLDMSDSTQSCPFGFRLYQSGGVRACGRPGSSRSCSSVQFPSNGISYSQVCGRVVGYQYGHTDAVSDYHNDINSWYVEGVSITRGSPRQHVWTLMAGITEANAASNSCPCNNGSTRTVVPFIGDNYFCESGNNASSTSGVLYTSDPLWDGSNCRSYEAPCCTAPGLPWFYRSYNSTTTDYIELRVCGDYGAHGEDSPVSFYEIYVK